MTDTTITMSPKDLEGLIRQVVRDELRAFALANRSAILDDPRHEGPEDELGDRQLLAEALAVLEEFGADPEAWVSWQDFKEQLTQAESAGELPD